jgi:hypothetical protein
MTLRRGEKNLPKLQSQVVVSFITTAIKDKKWLLTKRLH